VTTDYTGSVQRTETNLAFGDGFSETASPFVDFTGFADGFWDSENNADHFGAREYAKTQGRWLTPDPAGVAAVNPWNPQTWNRYAYVGNNPTTFVDPSGLFMALCNSPANRQCSTNDPTSGNIGVTWNELSLYTLSITSTAIATSNPDILPFLNSELGRMLALLSGQAWLVYGNADMFYWSAPSGGPGSPPGGPNNGDPQTPQKTPCAVPSGNHLSMGASGNVATVNPFTSGGGGVWGANRQSFGATTYNYTYSGTGAGLDVGASVQSVWAWGSGSWTGPFNSISVSAGLFSGSIFWTPGKGGWSGASFGLGIGSPGAAREVTNYTCRSGPG
jgi:RHS repeat-associated protein